MRPPHVLVSTLKYLIDHVVPQLPKSHPFLWDRTRSIRQDFTYQNYSGPEAIECNELIARVHLLSLHVMLTSDQEYSKQQELEQFNKTLQTLSELYDSNRKLNSNFRSPREAEFRSYLLISHINDPDIDRQIQLLPQDIYDDPKIQGAIKLRGMMQMSFGVPKRDVKENSQNLFAVLFQTLTDKSVSFLTSCLIESHFQDIRFGALSAMAKCYHSKGKPYALSRLTKLLGFGNEDDTASFCVSYGLTIVQDEQFLAVNVAPTALNPPSQFQNFFAPFIDVKKGDKSWSMCIFDDSSAPAFNSSMKKPTPFQTLPSAPKSIATNPIKSLFSPTNTTAPPAKTASPFVFGAPPTVPAFQFDSSKNINPSAPELSKSVQRSTPPTFSLDSTVTKPSEPVSSVLAPKFEPVPAPPPPKPKVVIKHFYEENDVRNESMRIMKEVTANVFKEILPTSWRKVQEKRLIEEKKQRQEAIRTAAVHEEFRDMVKQLVFEQTQNAKAVQMDNLRLSKLAVQLVNRAAFISKYIADQAARRKQEYEMISRQLGRPRLLGSGIITRAPSFTKERSALTAKQRYEHKMKEIKQQKEQASLFWRPLDVVSSIANPLESGLRKSHTYGYTRLRVSCFCRNWETVVGQWLQIKLHLGKVVHSTSKGTEVYMDQLQDDPETYKEMCQLIVAVGLSQEGQPQSDLKYCHEALHAILTRVKDVTKYKLNLMVMYWGGDGATESTVMEQLDIQDFQHCLNSTEFCAIDAHASNPSQILQEGIEKLTSSFEGALSFKGEREKQYELQRHNDERERYEYESYLEKVRQDEAERNRRLDRIQKMNSLHFFESAVVIPAKITGTGNQELPAALSLSPKHKRNWEGQAKESKIILADEKPAASKETTLQEDYAHVPKKVRELKDLIASVTNKRTKTAV